jgi:uncharacterized protein YndB with AHSA1/START domain
MSKLTLKTEGNTHVVVTRRFAAPPEAVYRAHADPKLIQKWLLGPEGWTMPVCISDARPGGKIRYEWRDGKGPGFHLTGEYLELEPYSRIVHVERMHLSDPTPDNQVETRFEADGTGTLTTMRMTLPGAQTRAAMLATGMEASYVRLEGMISIAHFVRTIICGKFRCASVRGWRAVFAILGGHGKKKLQPETVSDYLIY